MASGAFGRKVVQLGEVARNESLAEGLDTYTSWLLATAKIIAASVRA